jgi:hypothetical protein
MYEHNAVGGGSIPFDDDDGDDDESPMEDVLRLQGLVLGLGLLVASIVALVLFLYAPPVGGAFWPYILAFVMLVAGVVTFYLTVSVAGFVVFHVMFTGDT